MAKLTPQLVSAPPRELLEPPHPHLPTSVGRTFKAGTSVCVHLPSLLLPEQWQGDRDQQSWSTARRCGRTRQQPGVAAGWDRPGDSRPQGHYEVCPDLRSASIFLGGEKLTSLWAKLWLSSPGREAYSYWTLVFTSKSKRRYFSSNGLILETWSTNVR